MSFADAKHRELWERDQAEKLRDMRADMQPERVSPTGRYILVRPRWAGHPGAVVLPDGMGFTGERVIAVGTYDAVNAASRLMEMRDG